MRACVALALGLACAPAQPSVGEPPEASAAPQTAPARPSRALPAELFGIVEPWHAFDAAAAEASPIWLLTRYEPDSYPCRPGPDGSLDMLQQDRFTVVRVLRGAASAPGVDLDLYALRGSGRPRAFAEGRRYLLLIRPGPQAQALLADPRGLGGPDDRLGPPDVLGVVAVDESAAEVAAEATPASRTGEAHGYRWDPTRWSTERAAAAIDAASQRALAAFLEEIVLRPHAPLAEVRAWLGPPDLQRLGPGPARQDQYILARPAYATPSDGAIYGDLRLRFDARLALHAVELTYLRWHVSPRQRSSVALTPDEHAALGLPQLALEFR